MSELGGAPAWAVRGAKCICIDGNWQPPYDGTDVPPFAPAKGTKLTVSGIDGSYLQFDELPVLYTRLDGLVGELWWPASAFRPVIIRTAEQDMAIFAPLLGTRQPELERT
jgi:hypothetical protein